MYFIAAPGAPSQRWDSVVSCCTDACRQGEERAAYVFGVTGLPKPLSKLFCCFPPLSPVRSASPSGFDSGFLQLNYGSVSSAADLLARASAVFSSPSGLPSQVVEDVFGGNCSPGADMQQDYFQPRQGSLHKALSPFPDEQLNFTFSKSGNKIKGSITLNACLIGDDALCWPWR